MSIFDPITGPQSELNYQYQRALEAIEDILEGDGAIFYASNYDDLAVTVPNPTTAPVLTATDLGGNANGNLTPTTSYKVAYTYAAWNGETGLSPTVTVVATGDQGIAVLPLAALNNNSKYSVGAYFYLSDDGGSTWHRADGAFVSPALVSFGDEMVWGGYPIKWNAAGVAPPAGAATTTTKSGLTVSPPANAPTVTSIAAFGAATYYGAYAYLCGDGTLTGLSSISSSVTTSNRRYIAFQIPKEPPSGAVKVNLYLGTSATAGAMKLQATVPLNHVTPLLHSYNGSGAAHSAGTAQSIVSGFQQAIDAAIEAGGGRVVVNGITDVYVPVILRLKNAAGTQIEGLTIEGLGGDQLFGAGKPARIRYVGTPTGMIGVLMCGSAITWRDLDVYDPNSRIKYALATCDFFGGGSFNNKIYRSQFQAGFAGGIGFYLPAVGQVGTGNAHTGSNWFFQNPVFYADAWAMDMHGNQTGSMTIINPNFLSGGNSNSANSGYFRQCAGFNTYVEGNDSTGAAGYAFFSGGDIIHQQGSGGRIVVKNHHTEANFSTSPKFFVHVSQSAQLFAGVPIGLYSCSFSSNDADNFAFYTAGAAFLTLVDNERGGGNIWFNFVNAVGQTNAVERIGMAMIGRNTFFTAANFKANGNATSLQYSLPMFEAWLSGYALTNESGQQSLIQTNAAGDLVLSPYSNKVTVPDDAYNAATWDANLGVPTKNAIRDKIETLSSAITGVLNLKGNTDASANPNYPSAVKGDAYYITVAGKIGGASGKSVDVSDMVVAKADNAGGTEASVGTSWFVLEHNLVGALLSANNLSDVGSASTARSNLGLVIGTDVEAHDGDLTTIAGLTPLNDDVIQRKSGAWTNRTIAQLLADMVPAWTSYAPTWTNVTVGNGTSTGQYAQIGKLIIVRAALVFGSTTSISGVVRVSFPVTSVTYAGTASSQYIGAGSLQDATGSLYEVVATWENTGRAILQAGDSSGAYLIRANVNSTVPFTWAVNDEIHIQLILEAA
jgi:hypothetical protein